MRNTLETRLGLFFALAFVAAIIVFEMVGGLGLFRGYQLHARFNNVQELKVGDPVRMAGVNVGKVEDIRLVDNKVAGSTRSGPDCGWCCAPSYVRAGRSADRELNPGLSDRHASGGA